MIIAIGLFVSGLSLWDARRRSRRRRAAKQQAVQPRRRALWWLEVVLIPALFTFGAVGLQNHLDDQRQDKAEAEERARHTEDKLAGDLRGANLQEDDLEGRSLVDRDMSGATVRGNDLTHVTMRSGFATQIDARKSRLDETTLDDMRASEADLRGAAATRTRWRDVDLNSASLDSASITSSDLYRVDFSESTGRDLALRGTLLVDPQFEGAQWPRADLRDVTIVGSTLHGIDLTGADLSNAKVIGELNDEPMTLTRDGPSISYRELAKAFGLSQPQFERIAEQAGFSVADISKVQLKSFVTRFVDAAFQLKISLRRLALPSLAAALHVVPSGNANAIVASDTSLRGARLDQIDLRGQSLERVDLVDAAVDGTNLTDASLTDVLASGVHFNRAATDGLAMTRTKAQESVWSNTTTRSIHLIDVNLDYSDLRGLAVKRGTFARVSLDGADLRGADFSDATFDGVVLTAVCVNRATKLPAGVIPESTAPTSCKRAPAERRAPTAATNTSGQSIASAPRSRVPCGDTRCLALSVVGTLNDGRDEGLYIRACRGPKAECPRPLALAALGDIVWSDCRETDGLEVDGNDTWVRVWWDFVPDVVPPDGLVSARDTGKSSPLATQTGWASAAFLAPNEEIQTLPLCIR